MGQNPEILGKIIFLILNELESYKLLSGTGYTGIWPDKTGIIFTFLLDSFSHDLRVVKKQRKTFFAA